MSYENLKTGIKIVLVLGIIVHSIACHDKEALKQALIEKSVQEKVDNYIKQKKATCQREVMQEALTLADSIMIKLALSKVDTNSQLNRPIKPVKPDVNLPVDTTPIKPLFKDTLR